MRIQSIRTPNNLRRIRHLPKNVRSARGGARTGSLRSYSLQVPLEQIVLRLQRFKLMREQGATEQEALIMLGITQSTYRRWRKETGGNHVDQTKLLCELTHENF